MLKGNGVMCGVDDVDMEWKWMVVWCINATGAPVGCGWLGWLAPVPILPYTNPNIPHTHSIMI
jgi:hypothetical protein